MYSLKNSGRTFGILFFLHLITGLITPYTLVMPLNAPFSISAHNPGIAFRVRLAVMLLFIGGALTIAIALKGWPIFRQYSFTIAAWVLALAIANFALQCLEIAGYMSLFTFTQEYANAAGADLGIYNLVGAAVRTGWKWVHYTHLLIMVSWMFLLFFALGSFGLVPRLLAGLGMLCTVLQITGITLPQFLAYRSPSMMGMGLPLGILYLVLSVWLMVKGFPQKFAISGEHQRAEPASA